MFEKIEKDSEFTKYAAKVMSNRKNFYDKNLEATNRNYVPTTPVNTENLPQLVRRPTLRRG